MPHKKQKKKDRNYYTPKLYKSNLTLKKSTYLKSKDISTKEFKKTHSDLISSVKKLKITQKRKEKILSMINKMSNTMDVILLQQKKIDKVKEKFTMNDYLKLVNNVFSN